MVAMNTEYRQTNIEVRIFIIHMTKSGKKIIIIIRKKECKNQNGRKTKQWNKQFAAQKLMEIEENKRHKNKSI